MNENIFGCMNVPNKDYLSKLKAYTVLSYAGIAYYYKDSNGNFIEVFTDVTMDRYRGKGGGFVASEESKPDEEVAAKEEKLNWINIKNIIGRNINVLGQSLEPSQVMRVDDCTEVRNLIRGKYIEIVGKG